MMKYILTIIALTFYFEGNAQQWINMIDKIFECHSLRFEYGSWDYQEYFDMWDTDACSSFYGQYVESFDFASESGTASAIKFIDKRGQYANYCGNGIAGYMFSLGGSYDMGLIIFVDKIYPNCTFYIGPFMTARPFGIGRYYSLSGQMLMEGEFCGQDENAKPNYNYPNSSKRFLTTSTSNGFYIGESINGIRNGYGLYIWNDGDAWFGKWEDGARCGCGMMLYRNCTMKVGYWYGNDFYKNQQ